MTKDQEVEEIRQMIRDYKEALKIQAEWSHDQLFKYGDQVESLIAPELYENLADLQRKLRSMLGE